MAPQRKLIVIVTLAAVAIAAMWFALYRRHVLAPPLAPSEGGPSLPEIGKEFERASEQLREFSERAAAVSAPSSSPPPSASDDAVTPIP